jgi:uncharacterized protein (DUF1499 family)
MERAEFLEKTGNFLERVWNTINERTDWNALRRAIRRLIGIAFALAIVCGIAFTLWYVPVAGWSSNDVTTGSHPGYPDLKPRYYNMPVSETTAFASSAVYRLAGWKLISADRMKGHVVAQVTTWPIPFTDDLTVTVTPEGADGRISKVMMHSKSRVGKGDLGENYRHIKRLQAEMDKRLPQSDAPASGG